jgi:hypothetical protein
MSNYDHPQNPDPIQDPAIDDYEQDIIAQTFPILEKIHTRLADEWPKTMQLRTLDAQVKAVFDGAIYAHDQVRTRDWPNLKNQLEDIATNAILSLVTLQRRHENIGPSETNNTSK